MSAGSSLRSQARARWQTLSPREQRRVSGVAVLLGIALFYGVAIAPAQQTLRDSQARRAHNAQQLAHMQRLQAQAQALQTRTPLSREASLRRLQSLTPSPLFQLNVQGDRVSVQLKAVPATTLAQWLAQARQQAQVVPIEAHLTRTHQSTMTWEGSLILNLPSQGTAP